MTLAAADTASDQLLASYEAFPYDSKASSATHPDNLAAVAALHGLTTASPASCRVLELGCGTGGNLVAMAYGLPGSTFVGVDLSPRQIAIGTEMARALSLRNIRLEARSIADIDDDFGTFDYIICHGVYSWVPPRVRAAILRVCARNLAPGGIAFVSYNTYPGWHFRGLVRDLILFHDRPDLPPVERVTRGREIVKLIARSVPAQDSAYAAMLDSEAETLAEAADSYFLHEELESINHPVYFTEFAREAEAAGLTFLAEAAPSAATATLAREARLSFREWSGDQVQFEQYADFVSNRSFRQSLLCHAGTTFDPLPSPAAVPRLFVASRCTVDPTAEGTEPGVDVFRTQKGVAVTIAHPMLRAALHALAEARPAALSMDELLRRTQTRLAVMSGQGAGAPVTRDDLADAMLRSALVRLVHLHVMPPACATDLGPRPVGSPLGRLQATHGPFVTTAAHLVVELSPFDRIVLAHADGSRDVRGLADVVEGAIASGDLTLDGGPPPTPENLAIGVERALANLLAVGLIAG